MALRRARCLENDSAAVQVAWNAALAEGAVSEDLRAWRIPGLIFVEAGDEDFHDQAQRVANEIPDAEFVSVTEAGHLGAHFQYERVSARGRAAGGRRFAARPTDPPTWNHPSPLSSVFG